MALNSYEFMLFFLPVTLLVYFLLNRFRRFQAATMSLLVLSLVFYACSDPRSLIYIVGSILFNFTFSRIVARHALHQAGRKRWLIFAIVMNVLLLAASKYLNFLFTAGASVLQADFEPLDILVPLGISFITFQQIAYLTDSYRGETESDTFLDYAVFTAYFPKIISGPIVRHEQFIPQLQDIKRRQFQAVNFASGLYDFAVGLAKKVILAELFAAPVAWGFESGNLSRLTSAEAIIVMLAYTFQIYFDFSGYTDMALGVSRMLNLELPINFNSPYRAVSIGDFWKRWHISLTDFLRKYIYFPLGGSRRGPFRTSLNMLAIFLISGLWHGASLTFVVWGALHGIASVLHRRFSHQWEKVPRMLQWLSTFLFVSLAWVVFRAETLASAGVFYRRILSGEFSVSAQLVQSFKTIDLRLAESLLMLVPGIWRLLAQPSLIVYLILFACTLLVLFAHNTNEIRHRLTPVRAALTVIFLAWGLLSLSGITTFIYAGF